MLGGERGGGGEKWFRSVEDVSKSLGGRGLGRNADRTNDRGYIRSWQLGVALYFDKINYI